MLGITPWYVQVWELPRPLHRRGQVTVQLTVCWVHWARRYTVDRHTVDIINYNYQVRGLDRDDDKPPGERGGEVDTRRLQPHFIRDDNDRQLNNQDADTEENPSTAKLWGILETGHQRQHVKWLNPGVTMQRDEPRCDPRDNCQLLLRSVKTLSCPAPAAPHLIKSSMMIDKQQKLEIGDSS